jgi:hypothetical protein
VSHTRLCTCSHDVCCTISTLACIRFRTQPYTFDIKPSSTMYGVLLLRRLPYRSGAYTCSLYVPYTREADLAAAKAAQAAAQAAAQQQQEQQQRAAEHTDGARQRPSAAAAAAALLGSKSVPMGSSSSGSTEGTFHSAPTASKHPGQPPLAHQGRLTSPADGESAPQGDSAAAPAANSPAMSSTLTPAAATSATGRGVTRVTEDVVDDLLLKYQQLQQQLLLQEQEAGQAEGEGSTGGDQAPEGTEGAAGAAPAQQRLQSGQEEPDRAAAYEVGAEGDADAAADVSAELNLSDIQLLLSPSGASAAVTAESASLQPASMGSLQHAESAASVTSPVTPGSVNSQGREDLSNAPFAAAAGRSGSGGHTAAAGEDVARGVGGAVAAVQRTVSAGASPAVDAARRQQALARIKAAMQQDRSR